MLKNKPVLFSIIAVVFLVIAISTLSYYNSQKNIIGRVYTNDDIKKTECIRIGTLVNNMYPKSYKITDKDNIKAFYKWISSLKYKETLSDENELPPGTEFG